MEAINWVKDQKEGSNAYILSATLGGKAVDIICRCENVFMAYYDGTATHNIKSRNNHYGTFEEAEEAIREAANRGYANRR